MTYVLLVSGTIRDLLDARGDLAKRAVQDKDPVALEVLIDHLHEHAVWSVGCNAWGEARRQRDLARDVPTSLFWVGRWAILHSVMVAGPRGLARSRPGGPRHGWRQVRLW